MDRWSRWISAATAEVTGSSHGYGPPSYVEDLRALIEPRHQTGRGRPFDGRRGRAIGRVTFPEKLAAPIIVDSPQGPPPLLRRLSGDGAGARKAASAPS